MNMVRRSCKLLLIVYFIFVGTGAAFSTENVFLRGIIRNIDYRAGRIQVDVLNKHLACAGPRTFIVNNLSKVKLVVGKKIDFYIDSENCPGPDEVRTITGFHGGMQ